MEEREPIEQQTPEKSTFEADTNVGVDDLLLIIGEKEARIFGLRRALDQALGRIAELEAKDTNEPAGA